ncbi:MAG: alcohol dehydrogenase [Alphaproteobacteria bacterium MarineAlpha2_Bin1]|nr:MAG: alcohol dehydrogenase [Alphaproteobacteria bacterium MarineAlpha2_Bin1]
MKAIALTETTSISNLELIDRPVPEPNSNEVLVKLFASSLNYRDLLIAIGGYGSRQKKRDLIPLSDGSGEIVSVGSSVKKFKVGDRVLASFFQSWISGELTEELLDDDLGRSSDGVLTQYRCFKQEGLVKIPNYLSFIEAASLPCAALTAWSGIIELGCIKPGQTVLIQGTGGVSLFAMQFALMAGASVIVTSSSDKKIEILRKMGVKKTINYSKHPEWGMKVLEITDGMGVDHVMEVGGAGTLKQSIRSVKPGGVISIIGVLDGAKSNLLIPLIGSRKIRLQGVTVGSVENLLNMVKAMENHKIKPIIDKVYKLNESKDAYEYLKSGKHFGKICISHDL